MANHFHLLVKTPRANPQEFMRHLNICYTSHFSRAHQRTGHLYQGRYKAFFVQADPYLQKALAISTSAPFASGRGGQK